MIKTKRTYDKHEAEDGFRILVDRIWPRGLKKTNVKMDLWQKDIAPSTSLRKWFNHDESKWNEFKNRYYQELQNKESISLLLEKARKETITLLYSSKEEKYNNAIALKEYLEVKLKHKIRRKSEKYVFKYLNVVLVQIFDINYYKISD